MVILIILLLSVATLPAILSAVGNRQVVEAARILQAALAGARDAAIRARAPRGIRLLVDPSFRDVDGKLDPTANVRLGCNRIVSIEPGADLFDTATDSSSAGSASFPSLNTSWNTTSALPPPYPFPTPLPLSLAKHYPYPSLPTITDPQKVLMVTQAVFRRNDYLSTIPNPPTNWFWNVRLGDRFQVGDNSHSYTVVGPMTQPNDESFVNDGPPGSSTLQETYNDPSNSVHATPEFLFLVNGYDDNQNGYVDEAVDGLDQAGSVTGVDDVGEWSLTSSGSPEVEAWVGAQSTLFAQSQTSTLPLTFKWRIRRRPIPSPGTREVAFPAGVLVDLTTWNTTRERSRLPVDPFNGYVDVLLNPSGQVIPTTFYSTPAAAGLADSFLHFWIADRSDVVDPVIPSTGIQFPVLPMPEGLSPPTATTFLQKERQLVTLFAKNGQVVTNSIEAFDPSTTVPPKDGGANRPFIDAQLGVREAR